MKVKIEISTVKKVKTDAVTVFLHEDESLFKQTLKELHLLFGKKIDPLIALNEFTGKDNQILTYYTDRKIQAPRLFLVGLGTAEKCSLERYRQAAAAALKHAKNARCKSLAFSIPAPQPESQNISLHDIVFAITEGTLLSHYSFDKYQIRKDPPATKVSDIIILGTGKADEKSFKKAAHDATIICEGTLFARDLENAPPNEIYPETLAEAAKQSAHRYGYRSTIWDKKQIEKTGFGGLMAVNAGSNHLARFIILEHNEGRTDVPTVVLVGKGVTFDAGGISIKPASGMSEMKMDMSGAAAVIGTMEAATRLKLPIHLVGLIPATENLLGGSAMRPGDIIKHYGGLTSEVDNTDAEGRLILADALAYASTLKPDMVIDLATLTGACVVALGQHATGMMGNDEDLMTQLKNAGDKTYERVWQLPLFEEYEKQIKSDIADVKNVGGRWAGAITAALFLKKFIGKYKWVHLDIAGTAILEEALPYAPKGGSGVGVRLLIEFLKGLK
jgi:leucyl aminopeptidase